MHYGFRIVEDMTDGLSAYLDSKGMKSVERLRGRAVPTLQKWETLDLNYKRIASIDYDKCIGCNLCYIACEDGAHQAIDLKSPEELKVGLGPGRVPAQARAQGPRGGLRRLQPLLPRLPGRRMHHDGRNPQREDPHDLEQLPGPPRQGRDAAHSAASVTNEAPSSNIQAPENCQNPGKAT
jgi:NAD-dependent dihydropyrimidine dehydrogenase PreA subunit